MSQVEHPFCVSFGLDGLMILLQLVTCEVQEQTEPDKTQSLM